MQEAHIVYRVIYYENGGRKVRQFKFKGAPTGKAFKKWESEVHSIVVRDILYNPDRDFVMSAWEGLGKKARK